jgi:hypothetical protein
MQHRVINTLFDFCKRKFLSQLWRINSGVDVIKIIDCLEWDKWIKVGVLDGVELNHLMEREMLQ